MGVKCRVHSLVIAVIACISLAAGNATHAYGDAAQDLERLPAPVREYLIKAGFIVNFARFTEWPSDVFEGSGEPLRFCVLGHDPFGVALDTIAGKEVKGRQIEIGHPLWIEDALRCHVVFISDTARDRLVEILQSLDGAPILTIGDMPDVAHCGGIIGLENVENHIRFRINVDAAHRAGLTLSSRLLSLAEIVRYDCTAGQEN